jgi:hypothetical protein
MTPMVFQVEGVVSEKRELTSQKNQTWRGYILKVATIGATFELNATHEQFSSLNEGAERLFQGKIEDQRGQLRLTIQKIAELKKTA